MKLASVDVRIEPVSDPADKHAIGLKAYSARGKEIGCVDFSTAGDHFRISFVKVDRKYQGRGLATMLLDATKAYIPTNTSYVAFLLVTSKGVARLVERLFGKLYDYDYHAAVQARAAFRWHLMGDLSPQGKLRFTRGPSGYAEWPAPAAGG